VDCIQGNLCWLWSSWDTSTTAGIGFEWMARSVTGEGVASSSDKQAAVRYYAGKCGRLSLAERTISCLRLGRVKVMLAFSRWPKERHTLPSAGDPAWWWIFYSAPIRLKGLSSG